MLISQIVQLDAQSNEFARKHAASQIGRSDGGESFADYLAATMNPNQSRREAGQIQTDFSTAKPVETDVPPRDRTPEYAHRQGTSAAQVSGRRAESEDARTTTDAGRRTDDVANSASGGTKPTSEESADARESKIARKATDTGKEKPEIGSDASRDLPAEGRARARIKKDGADAAGRVSESPDASGDEKGGLAKASRVSSRRVSEGKVEIDVIVESDEAAVTKAAASAKKSSDATALGHDADANDLRTDKTLADRSRKNASSRTTVTSGSSDDKAETVSAVRSQSAKAEKAADSDDGSARGDRRVEVRDLRGSRGRGRDSGDSTDGGDGRRSGGETAAAGGPSSDNEARSSQSTGDRSSQFEALRSESGSPAAASRGNESPSRAANATAGNLRQTLQDNLNNEIVRSARLVVRGNGSGEIRLNLRPDSLGGVRISLQMHDGHIAGRIIVDNQTVREVFEQNLASLQKAFEESGLEAGGVEISLADSGDQPEQGADKAPHRATVREVADRFGYGVPDLSTIEEYHDLVDVVV